MKTQHQPSSWEKDFDELYIGSSRLRIKAFIRQVESSALKRGMAHELTDEELENSAYFKARIKMARDEGRDEGSKGDYGRKMFQGGYREGLQAALEVLPEEKDDVNEAIKTLVRLTAYNHVTPTIEATATQLIQAKQQLDTSNYIKYLEEKVHQLSLTPSSNQTEQ